MVETTAKSPGSASTLGPSVMLRAVLASFAAADLDYAVMRNWDNLPDQSGRDLDLLACRADFDRLIAVIEAHVQKYDGWLVERRAGSVRQHLNVVWPDGSRLSFDIQWDLSHHRMTYSDGSRLLGRAILDDRGFRRLCDADAAVTAIVNGVLTRSQVKPKYRNEMAHVLNTQNQAVRRSFVELLGTRLGESWFARAKLGRWDDGAFLKAELVRSLRSRVKSGLGVEVLARAHSASVRLRHAFRPTAPFIVLLGTHGAGKTTTARALVGRLERAGYPTQYYHINSRPGVLKALNPVERPPVLSRDESPQYSALPTVDESSLNLKARVRATARLLYHALDFTVFQHGIAYPRQVKGQGFVSDRYLYDYLVEPRGVAGSPMWLRWLLSRMTKAPTLLIHLKASPATIHARKAELPMDVLQAQIDEFDRVVELLGGVSVVVDRPTAQVCDEILGHLGPIRTDPLP